MRALIVPPAKKIPVRAARWVIIGVMREWEHPPETPLRELCAVSLDFEATGPEAHKREIIEIGAVRIVNGRVDESQILNQRILPRKGVTLGAWQVHGIRRKHLLSQPSLQSFWPRLADFLRGQPLVGHHIHFDIRLLRHQLRRLGVRWRPHPALCTGYMHMLARKSADHPALDDLLRRFNIPDDGRHTGLGDALMAARLMVRLAPDLERVGVVTVADALAAQRPVRARHIRQVRAARGRL